MPERPAHRRRDLLADESAIDRITDRLLEAVSLESGVVHMSGREEARAIVEDLLRVAAGESGL
jgi:hypothetical protein